MMLIIAVRKVLVGSRRFKDRKVFLFFDTFEQLAAEAVPWLLYYFLPANINGNIVLVIAGRDPVERSIPDDTKRWLPHIDNESINWIPLNSFTEDETYTYLTKRNITDPDRITTIWQLSQGLPLYLSLLTSNPPGKVDPAADVVANFLRWIPEKEHAKRQLALDAALFFGPFNQDDLAAFIYLPENEQPSLYHWLISQPFVRTQDGGYSYHNLARELFSRHLYQRSRKGYYTTRRALVQHYQQLIEEIQLDEGTEVYASTEWLELKLSLACQLLLLPDEGSHIKAIEQVVSAHNLIKTEQRGEIARVLRELSQKHTNIMVHSSSRQIARQLLHFIEADPRSKERVVAISNLLEKVSNNPAFPQELLARLYIRRGMAFSYLNEYHRAIEDCDRALQLDPKYTWAYICRSIACRGLNKYRQAIEDCNQALELNSNYARAYFHRSIAYSRLHEFQAAIEDCNQAHILDPRDSWAYIQRGTIYRELKDYQQAFEDFEIAIELNPNEAWAYAQRGITYSILKQYEAALADFNRTIELNPKYARIYGRRGFIYLVLNDITQAQSNYARSWEQDSTLIHFGWMAEWTSMCQSTPDLRMAERLEIIASSDPEAHASFVCRSVAMWLRQYYNEALVLLEQAIQVGPDDWGWDSSFWKGMTYASLGRDEEAIAAVERSLELELPPILLTPLCWFEQDRPDFYQKYVVPLMARYDLG
jgi:tetratricopeptide (TPR) repeat protein